MLSEVLCYQCNVHYVDSVEATNVCFGIPTWTGGRARIQIVRPVGAEGMCYRVDVTNVNFAVTVEVIAIKSWYRL